MGPTLIRNARVDGRPLDVRIERTVAALDTTLVPQPGEQIFEAHGMTLTPGLHDHHIHLHALHAARHSVDCGPAVVRDATDLARVLGAAPGAGWVRGFGYHESTLGELRRWELDRVHDERPVRLQHRSGKLWVLNSPAADLLGLENERHAGVERDRHGRVTGRLFRMDDWLAERIEERAPADLEPLWSELFSYGITGVTDASYTNSIETVAGFARRRAAGELMPRVDCMGDDSLDTGPLKVMLDDERLPELAGLVARIEAAHERGRPAAFHCVSHLQLVFALAALRAAGHRAGDRIEHGAVIAPEMIAPLRDSGCVVVTQPGFIGDRGDAFKAATPAEEWGSLYRFQSLLEAGIEVIASSDAPYGPVDPALVARSAFTRATETGDCLGRAESVSVDEALRGYCSAFDGTVWRRQPVVTGLSADLCLWSDVPGCDQPCAVWCGGLRVR